MRATPPYVDVPGDNFVPVALHRVGPDGFCKDHPKIRERIMGRSGECLGMTTRLAVWRFGFTRGSEAANAYDVHLDADVRGFLWVLATRKTGKVKDTFQGYAVELPREFQRVIDS